MCFVPVLRACASCSPHIRARHTCPRCHWRWRLPPCHSCHNVGLKHCCLSERRRCRLGLALRLSQALRWALTHTSFEVLLKTDDDTVVHVGRLWMWLSAKNRVNAPGTALSRLYAGRIFPGAQGTTHTIGSALELCLRADVLKEVPGEGHTLSYKGGAAPQRN